MAFRFFILFFTPYLLVVAVRILLTRLAVVTALTVVQQFLPVVADTVAVETAGRVLSGVGVLRIVRRPLQAEGVGLMLRTGDGAVGLRLERPDDLLTLRVKIGHDVVVDIVAVHVLLAGVVGRNLIRVVATGHGVGDGADKGLRNGGHFVGLCWASLA